MSIIAADTIKSRVAGAAVTTTGGLYVGGACTSISSNVTGVSTAQGGIKVPDSAQAIFGDGDDLAIDHAGGNSRITNSTGWMMINGAQVSINNAAGTEYQATFVADGASSLYYNASKKFETHNTGVKITGVSTITDLNVTGVATVTSLEATTSVIGSGVTINSSGLQVTSGIVTAGTCFKAGGGTWGPGIGATILGSGAAVFAGIVTATTFAPTVGQLSNRNLLINGGMQIFQRGTSQTGVTASGFMTGSPDRYRFSKAGSDVGTYTVTQHADSPDELTSTGKCFKIDCTTANSSLATNERYAIEYNMEGYDCQSILAGSSSAKQITLSFWVKAYQTGTFIVLLDNADSSRDCSGAYTINQSATWEKKTITFPADTTGSFDSDNAKSLAIKWILLAGSTWNTGTLNTSWRAEANSGSCTGQTNLASSTDNYYQITGIQLEVGEVATPFEHRSFTDELARCHRYYQRWTDGYLAGNSQGSDINIGIPLSVPLRAAPTVAALDMHRSGNQSVTVGIVGAYYTDLTSTVLRVRTSGWTSMSDETVYTVTPSSDTMEMSAEL